MSAYVVKQNERKQEDAAPPPKFCITVTLITLLTLLVLKLLCDTMI